MKIRFDLGMHYLVFAWLLVVFGRVDAADCTRYERDKAQTLSEQAAEKIVAKFMGGRDLRVTLRECEFNSYDGKYRTKVEIFWNGSFFRDNTYNIDGLLNFGIDGAGAKFSQTYASQSVKDLAFWGSIAGGVIILGALSAENSVSQGVPIYFYNRCSHPVKLALHYDDPNESWKTVGWWEFSGSERSRLLQNGTEVRTKNSVIYFWAESTDGSKIT